MLYEQHIIGDLKDLATLVRIHLAHLITIGVILGYLSVVTISQTLDEDSNWFKLVKDRDDYYSRFDFTRYSAPDVLNAAKIYKRIESTPPADEWEGVYGTQVAVGESELRWSARHGFVFHHVYHTLSVLDHGTVRADSSSLQLHPLNTTRKTKSPLFTDKLIKVKVGKKHFLVPESRLKDFALRAVGREVTDLHEWHFWQRIDESEVVSEGFPTFPAGYQHFRVLPITSRIIRVGRTQIIPSEYTTQTVNYDGIHIPITLADGYEKGIKVGMDFFIPALGEWAEVIKVERSRSIARIQRDFDLELRVQCRDSERGSGMPHPCKKVKAGLTVTTKGF
ncbi:MAG TPA: hypothetical protein VFZ49_07020 [Pyrinomonadaceae bacterium]